jgi:acyl-CoA synthetase (AMP-forming)/AMP-acid ligase II
MAAEYFAICKKKNIRFIVMYGQTESTARMSYLPWENAEEKAAIIGIAIPGGKFWIENDDGKIIDAPDIAGELIFAGDNVTLGYAENRFDLEKGDENKGVLHTGDMATRDGDGFYYVVGRKKRFLKIFGNRVNLDEVESLLKKENIEAACSGVDDMLHVYVTSCDDEKKAAAFIGERTAINRGGYKVLVIDEIPRNEAGKVLYSALE